MIRPHLLLTLLVFVAIGAYFAHFMSEQRTVHPLPGGIANGGSANTGGSTGRTNAGATNAGPTSTGTSSGTSGTANPYADKQAYNDRRSYDDDRSDRDDVSGQFDYYVLVLSWSPTYCSDEGRDDDTQCNRRDGGRYSFVLHGLWPQYESGYPRNCRLPRRPFVPDPVINSMLDIMPSRGLVIHEYRTHGTCSGLDPARYFSMAHRLFDGVTIPQRFQNPMESQITSAVDVKRAFLQANPQFRPDMVAVVCGGAGGMLREVRLCLTKDGSPRSCGQNETRRSLCTASQVFVPPSRSTPRNNWQNQQPSQLPQQLPSAANGNSPRDHLPGPGSNFNFGRNAQ